MSDDNEELFAAVEEALSDVAIPTDAATQFFTMEALHQLSHTLGDLYHDECTAALDRIEQFDDEAEAATFIQQFLIEQRARFEHWLFVHELPFVIFYCEHMAGVMLMWEIKAREHK